MTLHRYGNPLHLYRSTPPNKYRWLRPNKMHMICSVKRPTTSNPPIIMSNTPSYTFPSMSVNESFIFITWIFTTSQRRLYKQVIKEALLNNVISRYMVNSCLPLDMLDVCQTVNTFAFHSIFISVLQWHTWHLCALRAFNKQL